MAYETISSFQNSKIKQAKKLHDKRHRQQSGLFAVDDARDLARALANGYAVVYALFSPGLATPEEQARAADLPQVYEVTPELMQKASYRQNPGGLMAVLRQQPPAGYAAAVQVTAQHILALVGLEKPGNVGALLRTADAAGFTAIFLVDTALDIYNPNIIRSSTGACFLRNLYQLSSTEAQAIFRDNGYQVVAAHLAGDTSLFALDLRRKSAIVLGTEDRGLPEAWVAACDRLVRIPMVGQLADSLNVSVSGAIFMYEALRQQQLGDGF